MKMSRKEKAWVILKFVSCCVFGAGTGRLIALGINYSNANIWLTTTVLALCFLTYIVCSILQFASIREQLKGIIDFIKEHTK